MSVGDGVERAGLFLGRKAFCGEGGTVKSAVGKKDILSEGNAKLGKARLARCANETGDIVTIYYVKPEGGKYFECFGFSRTHSTA